MTYYLGQPFRLELTVEDVNGALVDPDTVNLLFRTPAGVDYSGPAAVRDSLGKYHADCDLPTSGRWPYRWLTTGPGAGVTVGDVVMVDPFAPQVVTLDRVKRQLNIAPDNGTHDVELADFIGALPEGLEQIAGPILPRTYTEVLTGPVLVVRRPPIASVTSLSWAGVTIDVSTLVDRDDLEAGIIRFSTTTATTATVTYVSGRVPIPDAISLAARIIVEHWWTTQRGRASAGRSRRDDVDTIDVPGLGFAIPRYAAELVAPFNPRTGMH